MLRVGGCQDLGTHKGEPKFNMKHENYYKQGLLTIRVINSAMYDFLAFKVDMKKKYVIVNAHCSTCDGGDLRKGRNPV